MSDLIIDERHDIIPALSVGNFQATPTGLVIAGNLTIFQDYSTLGL